MRRVHYEQDMRETAKRKGMGLFTLEVIKPRKSGTQFGGGIVLQGPIDEEDTEKLTSVLLGWIDHLNKKSKRAKAGGK